MVNLDGSSTAEALIRARGLSKAYWRGGQEVSILQGLDLDVQAGFCGSTAHRVIRESPCPVLAVRQT